MSVETLAALAAAFGVGGIAGVVLRAEHERAERRRDRMVAVAEEFLSAVEVPITSIRLVESLVMRFDFDERDESKRVAASKAAVDAMSKASGELRAAEAISARFDLIFPLGAQGLPKELQHFQNEAPTHTVIASADRLLATLELMLSTPAVTRQHMVDAWTEFGGAHGAFTRYANEAIWRRWYTPITSRLRRK